MGSPLVRTVGRAAIGAALVVLGYGFVAPSIRVVVPGPDSAPDWVAGPMLMELGKIMLIATLAALVIASVSMRRERLTLRDFAGEARSLPSALFAFLAGGFLIAFKPMADLFNVVDVRSGRGPDLVEVSPLRVAFAVAVALMWLWTSMSIGSALASRRASQTGP